MIALVSRWSSRLVEISDCRSQLMAPNTLPTVPNLALWFLQWAKMSPREHPVANVFSYIPIVGFIYYFGRACCAENDTTNSVCCTGLTLLLTDLMFIPTIYLAYPHWVWPVVVYFISRYIMQVGSYVSCWMCCKGKCG